MSSVRFRQTTILDPASVAPYGSEAWADECRKKLQYAVSRAVGGRLEFDRDVQKFWELQGWKVLKNAQGECFKTFREFALAQVPEGLQLTMNQLKAFMADIHKAMEEVAQDAEVHAALPKGRPKKAGTTKVANSHNIQLNNLSSTSVDRMARRIARDHPEILARMKAGEYKSVRAAAKDAGIVKDLTPLQETQRAWKHATLDDKKLIIGWIQDRLRDDEELLNMLG